MNNVNSPPRRRWTRSQSREVEAKSGSHKQSRGDDRDGGGDGGGGSGKGWGKKRDIESECLFFISCLYFSALFLSFWYGFIVV